jgi:4-amino-4-deoxy-L-arabinose transferase-like glycosyltransferase
MAEFGSVAIAHAPNRRLAWLGALLIVVGFLGHFFAARAIGGSYIAFRDHIFGFFLILVVTGGIIAWLGTRFWKGRRDLTVLIIGVVQALFGIVIYIFRYHV